MSDRVIEPSELILNPDGSIYHLHLLPEHIADTIILVGDPGRVERVSHRFTHVECKISNREFHTHTGIYNGKRMTVLSTGIGTDNIDIVVNELDALVNIDLKSRTEKTEKKSLNLVRLGTSGGLQADIDVDSFLMSEYAIGFDGLLNFYRDRNKISDLDFEKAFKEHTGWNSLLPSPYITKGPGSIPGLDQTDLRKGVTISAPGFYGPQGRVLRLALQDSLLNDKINLFNYKGHKITNYEMECSALYGLSALLGHSARTICVIIANRMGRTYSKDYKASVEKLIDFTLENLTK